MSYDEIPRVNIKNARVISRRNLSHLREPVVTVRPDGIQFNSASIARFPDTTYVLPLIDKEDKMLYLVMSSEDEIDSQKWANIKDDKRQSRKITGRGLGAKIYREMGWNKGYSYRAYGSLALQEEAEDELVLCFELGKPDRAFLTEKARASLGITIDDLGDEAEAVLAEDARRKEEQEQREKDKTEGRTPQKKKDTTEYYVEPDGDEFGPKYSEHKGRIRIPRTTDGQMTIDDFDTLTNEPESPGNNNDQPGRPEGDRYG